MLDRDEDMKSTGMRSPYLAKYKVNLKKTKMQYDHHRYGSCKLVYFSTRSYQENVFAVLAPSRIQNYLAIFLRPIECYESID